MTLRIAGGRVYDPANGVAGEVRDVCLRDGKVVADLPAHAPRIDARGMVVMPGGVDIHAHIAGPKVNAARRLAPEEHRGDVHRPHARSCARAPAARCRRRSSPATATRCSATRRSSRRRRRRSPPATSCAELRDTPMIDAALPAAAGQQRRAVRPHPPRPGARARRGRLVAGGDRRLRRQARQPGRRRALEARQRQRHLARRRGRRRHAAAGDRGDRRRRCTSSGSRTPSTCTATTSASRATGARRSTRCARSRAGAPTSRICSSTPTAAGPAGARARARRSSPSTSARTPSSAPTSAR